ncbi:MAG TPA: thioredoxin family protein, partial [Plasticicumulans sp.]|nr:thioredoxin family protein [Plasticicumulans sp.]
DIDKAEPYFRNALHQVLDGQPVEKAVTRPYGCTVKYAS